MGECPDKQCQKRIEDHSTTLFGEDGLHGIAGQDGSISRLNSKVDNLKACIGKKVSSVRFYITLGVVIASIFGIVTPFVTGAMEDWNTKKDNIARNTAFIKEQREINKAVQYDIAEIKSDLRQLKESRGKLIDSIKEAVKEAVRDSRNK